MGAMHGDGRLIVASISAFPSGVAGKGSVETFLVAGDPPTIVWQLTTALKAAIGFVPCRFPGTGGPLNRTSPLTCTSRFPSLFSCPRPSEIIQGRPPPFIPRMALAEPTNGPVTATIVPNSRTAGSEDLADPATSRSNPTARYRPFFTLSTPLFCTGWHN